MELTSDQVRRLRLRSQSLAPRAAKVSVAEVVRNAAGLQAQDMAAATLGVRARSADLTAADVHRGRNEERTVVRTWLMRGTLHLVAAEDLGWLLPLHREIFLPANRRRRAELGLNDETCSQGTRLIRKILAGAGPLTRAELVVKLDARGLHLEGQARIHLIHYATMQGVVCYGPDRDGEETFVLLDDWIKLDAPPSSETALSELARRYVAAFGPTRQADFAAWSGLPAAPVRQAWSALTSSTPEVSIDGEPAWMPAARTDDLASDSVSARLLPAFDTYLLGYRDRAFCLPPPLLRRVHPGGGIIRSTLLVDGMVAGIWSTKRSKKGLQLHLEPFDDLPPDAHAAVVEEAADLERFLDTTVQLT